MFLAEARRPNDLRLIDPALNHQRAKPYRIENVVLERWRQSLDRFKRVKLPTRALQPSFWVVLGTDSPLGRRSIEVRLPVRLGQRLQGFTHRNLGTSNDTQKHVCI